MPFHDHGLIPGLDRVGNLLEVDSKMGRAHFGFSHPPTLPPGSDISGPERKKIIFFRIGPRGEGRRGGATMTVANACYGLEMRFGRVATSGVLRAPGTIAPAAWCRRARRRGPPGRRPSLRRC